MAAKQESTGMGRSRTVLLALLVISSVAGAIHFFGGSDDKPAPKEYVDEDVVEVAPVVPMGKMSGASWRSAEQVREDRAAEDEAEVHGESILDRVEWNEDEGSRAYDKSVEDTVREIDGLGVYIAPADKKDAPKKK